MFFRGWNLISECKQISKVFVHSFFNKPGISATLQRLIQSGSKGKGLLSILWLKCLIIMLKCTVDTQSNTREGISETDHTLVTFVTKMECVKKLGLFKSCFLKAELWTNGIWFSARTRSITHTKKSISSLWNCCHRKYTAQEWMNHSSTWWSRSLCSSLMSMLLQEHKFPTTK